MEVVSLINRFGLIFLRISFVSLSFTYAAEGNADWCSRQNVRCRIDGLSRDAGDNLSAYQSTVNSFAQRMETYLNSRCPGGAARDRQRSSLICGNNPLNGVLSDVTFVGNPFVSRMLRMPPNGIRLIYDCQGAHLQLNMALIQTEQGLNTLMEIFNGPVQTAAANAALSYATRVLNPQHSVCGESYVPAVFSSFRRQGRAGHYQSEQGTTSFAVPRRPIVYSLAHDQQLPQVAITQACLGETRSHPRTTAVASVSSVPVTGVSLEAHQTPPSAPPVSQVASRASSALPTYTESHEERERLWEDVVPSACGGSTPSACEAVVARLSALDSQHFDAEEVALSEKDLAGMARANHDERSALYHDWEADRVKAGLEYGRDLGYESLSEQQKDLVHLWYDLCQMSEYRCNCQHILPDLTPFLPEDLVRGIGSLTFDIIETCRATH